MTKSRPAQTPEEDDSDEIISERHLFRDFPVTKDEIEDAVDDGHLRVIHSANGGRFYLVCEVESYLAKVTGQKRRIRTQDRSSQLDNAVDVEDDTEAEEQE